jgi:hypothetical protein
MESLTCPLSDGLQDVGVEQSSKWNCHASCAYLRRVTTLATVLAIRLNFFFLHSEITTTTEACPSCNSSFSGSEHNQSEAGSETKRPPALPVPLALESMLLLVSCCNTLGLCLLPDLFGIWRD